MALIYPFVTASKACDEVISFPECLQGPLVSTRNLLHQQDLDARDARIAKLALVSVFVSSNESKRRAPRLTYSPVDLPLDIPQECQQDSNSRC
jgi:hypothetical protein